jgi:hypothetical protein
MRACSTAGPAIVDGAVYWGNGHTAFGTPSTAFSVPHR